MLQELTIKNFAIISELHLVFQEGMTALTGETGAGKSIIIDAVGLLAGGRGSADFIRQDADKCLIEGLFAQPVQEEFHELAEELGLEIDEAGLIVQRDLHATGKSVCRVNGRIVTLSNLRRIGAYLVDIQGQNDHQELMHAENHLSLLDRFAGKKFTQQKAEYQKRYELYRQEKKRLAELQQNEQAFVQRLDMLHFQQEEIANAELVIGEEEQLSEERDKLANFQKIAAALSVSYDLLSGEMSSVDQIGQAVDQLDEIANLDADYQEIHENVQSAYYLLQDAASDLSRQMDLLEMDEGRLEEVTLRLESIRQLKRKYGESVAEILAYYEQISKEVAAMDFSEGHLDKLQQQVATSRKEVEKLAGELHKQRVQAASVLEGAITEELQALYMGSTVFEVRFLVSGQKLQENGFDQVEFYITTNPGEPLKPLVKVASGGELSRVMLALKTIFSKVQKLTSIVFDEVDTGVSGRVAQAIADKIYEIGGSSQVLCITHLPQVAARADHQYFIEKVVKKGRTTTHVRPLSEDERSDEIARMLAGAEITELTVQHAKELLAMAQK